MLGALKSIQRYRVRERKWQTREMWGNSPLQTNERKKTELQVTLKACIHFLTLYQPGE